MDQWQSSHVSSCSTRKFQTKNAVANRSMHKFEKVPFLMMLQTLHYTYHFYQHILPINIPSPITHQVNYYYFFLLFQCIDQRLQIHKYNTKQKRYLPTTIGFENNTVTLQNAASTRTENDSRIFTKKTQTLHEEPDPEPCTPQIVFHVIFLNLARWDILPV